MDHPIRVVTAISPAPGSDVLLERAGALAERFGAELIGVHARDAGDTNEDHRRTLIERRQQLQQYGGRYLEIASSDVARGIARFAADEGAQHIVIGSSRRSMWQRLIGGSLDAEIRRIAPNVELHIIPTGNREPASHHHRAPKNASVFSRRRRYMAWIVAGLGPIAMTGLLLATINHPGLASDLLMFLPVVICAAVLAGQLPAICSATLSFTLANYFFTEPLHTFAIDNFEDVIALVIFLMVAITIGTFVSRSSKQSFAAVAERSRAETLASLAGTIDAEGDPIEDLLERVRAAFRAESALLYQAHPSEGQLLAAAGNAAGTATGARLTTNVDPGLTLEVRGAAANATDDSVLNAFAASMAATMEQRRLRREAERAARFAEVDNLRNGLLSAVSHDLRTPLSVIKANASTLIQPDIDLEAEVRLELLETIEQQADRLTRIVSDLLDLGRIRTGSVVLYTTELLLHEVIGSAMFTVDRLGRAIKMSGIDDLPEIRADGALLERVIANIIDNACKFSPAEAPIDIVGSSDDRSVTVAVVDHGEGIVESQFDEIFSPFRRLGDSNNDGSGLGLAVAHGFCREMGFDLVPSMTQGGGFTMTLRIPTGDEAHSVALTR